MQLTEILYLCLVSKGYHMRGEVMSVLSLEEPNMIS